jgi:sirohydrochlorin ferrochelatase
MSTALVIASLGSRAPGGDATVSGHAAWIRKRGRLHLVEVGFVNGPGRSLGATLRLIAGKATHVAVVPYFLEAGGRYVTHTIPEEVDAIRPRFPRVAFSVTTPLLPDSTLAAIVAKLATEAGASDSDDTAVVIVAHGADGRTVDDAAALSHLVTVTAFSTGRTTVAGFLDGGTPTVVEVISGCATGGTRRMIVVPLFLHPGKHVSSDIPGALGAVRRRFPALELVLTPVVGSDPEVARVVERRALGAIASLTRLRS